MKIFFKSFFALFFLLSLSLFSQPNSVELRTSGGTLVGSYSSILEAYNAITTPVSQSYIIEILAAYTQASETLPITLTAKDGTDPSKTITIRPAAGNTGEVISGNSTTGILILNGADYVTIDGRPGGTGTEPDFKIINLATSGTNSNTIQLIDGATHNTLKYLHVINNTQNTAGPRAIVLATTTSIGNSHNTITHCKIEGGRSGIGLAGTAATPNDSITITHNEIFNWGYAGIWVLSGQANTTMDSNKIYHTVGVNNTLVSGIIMSTIAGATYNIRKNLILDLKSTSTSSTSLRGIYSAGPAAGSVINIENNMISIAGEGAPNAQTITGIELLGSNNYTANIFYNTAVISGTHNAGTSGATTSAGIRIGGSALRLFMKNNIAINKRTGGNVFHIGFALVSTTGILDIDYNCWYAAGTNSYPAYWGTAGYTDIAAYKTAATPNEQHSLFKDVSFVSMTDLHLTGASINDNELYGIPIAEITSDFDGDLRSTVNPFKGADEGSSGGLVNVTFNTDSLWNIVAVPGNTTITHKDSLFKDNVSSAYWFDGTSYTTVTNLQQGKGYWLKFNAPKSHIIPVTPQSPLNINLTAGWNMIGGLHVDVTAANITSNPPGIISSPFYGYNKGYVTATTIEKGKGYWVKLNASGTLTIPSSILKSKTELYNENILTGLANIQISDAAGNMIKLFLTDKSFNENTELPPIPPAGIFDARFSSGKFVENISGSRSKFEINSAAYPVKIRANEASIIIKDIFGGKYIDREIKPGEEITISDSRLNKFVINGTTLPTAFALYQNYPNPFNPVTKIKYQIPENYGNKIVTLKIYDILGSKIATLVNEVKQPGTYTVEFNGSKYPSGIYFYELNAGNYRDTRKMIMIK